MGVMEKVISLVNKMVHGCIFVFTLVLVFVTGAQILLRVVFDLPLSWSEEVARYFFIWWVFFGAAVAFRERRHLGIDALVLKFPKRLRPYWEAGIYILVLGYLAVMFYQGLKLMRAQMIHNTPITDVPLGVIVTIIPLCALLMGLYATYLIRKGWKEKINDQ